MTLPSIVLGLVITVLLGALYHAIRGGGGWRLLLFIALSLIGFFLAQWPSVGFGWSLYSIGSLEVGLGGIGSVLFLTVGDWLIRP